MGYFEARPQAVANSLEEWKGKDPEVPDYPLTCMLSVSNSGDPQHSNAQAVAFNAEGYFAALHVKTTYSCPQHVHSDEPKLVTYHHQSITREHFQAVISQGDTEDLHISPTGEGKSPSTEELCAAFAARFATGARVVPNPLRPPCLGWSDETGCPGHTIPVGTQPV